LGSIRYAVQPTDTSLDFEARSSLHPVHGHADQLTGYVDATFNQDGSLASEPAPAMHVEFPVERLRSGNSLQDREMWKLIDSKRFPLVAADLRAVRADGATGRYQASGDITLAGRQRRYEGAMKVAQSGDRVSLEGELVLDITDFGLKPPRVLMLKVEPKVTVRLKLIAERAA